MRLLTPTLALLLLLVPIDDLWIEPVQASFFSSLTKSDHSNAIACGASHAPCPVSAPCCNSGICQRTSSKACSIALGCEPEFSHPQKDSTPKHKKSSLDEYEPQNPQSCFPLPVCRSFTEKFKGNNADKKGLHIPLIPKENFTGDPDSAHWTSDFDHVASYAVVDPKLKKLVLKAKRDTVKTQSGGGFGATVSSTRWNRYGTFAAKFKSGATGPGIVTAMMLSNPILGEEITIEVTGRDPKTVVTDFYRHSAQDTRSASWLPSFKSVVPSLGGLRTRTRKLKDMILPSGTKTKKNKALTTDVVVIQHSDAEDDGGEKHDEDEIEDESLEEFHSLKKSATEHELVYKIEWTPQRIQWSVDGQVIRTLLAKDLMAQKGYGLPSHPMQLQLTIWDAGYNKETEAWAGGRTDYGENDEKEYTTLVDWIENSCHDRKEYKHSPWPGKDASKRLEKAEQELKVEQKAKEKEEKKIEAEAKKKRKEEEKKQKKADKAAKKEDKAALKATKTGGWWLFGRGKKEVKAAQEEKKTFLPWGRSSSSDSQGYRKSNKSKSSTKNSEPSIVAKAADSMISLLLRWSIILVALVGSAAYLTEPLEAQKQRQQPYVVSNGFKASVLKQ
ncbi:hypothetical protein EDD11_003167 [Mortierella claussenii]|nr:hypothetical protein EDD11_003167 [Mortierella claussenii]